MMYYLLLFTITQKFMADVRGGLRWEFQSNQTTAPVYGRDK